MAVVRRHPVFVCGRASPNARHTISETPRVDSVSTTVAARAHQKRDADPPWCRKSKTQGARGKNRQHAPLVGFETRGRSCLQKRIFTTGQQGRGSSSWEMAWKSDRTLLLIPIHPAGFRVAMCAPRRGVFHAPLRRSHDATAQRRTRRHNRAGDRASRVRALRCSAHLVPRRGTPNRPFFDASGRPQRVGTDFERALQGGECAPVFRVF